MIFCFRYVQMQEQFVMTYSQRMPGSIIDHLSPSVRLLQPSHLGLRGFEF